MGSIDVIVPCYNYGRFLPDCIESIVTQPVERLRVLIIDDASTDDSAAVAADLADRDPRITLVQHRSNIGHIATYNEGLAWARADYVLVLSADDMLLPGALRRAAELMDDYPEVGLTFGRYVCFADGFPARDLLQGGVPLRPSSYSPYAAEVEAAVQGGAAKRLGRLRLDHDRLNGTRILGGREFILLNRHVNVVHMSTAMMRRELQERLGGYRPELPHAGDLELWLRIATHAPVAFIDAHLAAIRTHGANMSKGYSSRMLFDVEQRKDVLDALFGNHVQPLADDVELQAQMYRALAEAAVRAAGVPFTRGDERSCQELLAFALELDPAVRRSRVWQGFALKRRFGPRVWSLLGPGTRSLARRMAGIPS